MAYFGGLDNLRAVVQKVLFIPIIYGFISLLPMFLSGWETSDRLTDRLFSVVRSRENTFDFVVVGGGTAGALIANRLAEHYRVLLLEAGGTPSPFQSIPALNLKFLNQPQTDWSHKTVPQRKACLNSVNQQSSWSSGKGLGGTTNINFMLHTRGHPMDFERWAQDTGDPSWGYAGVLPYFKRYETFSGTSNDPEARGHAGELKIRNPSYIGLSEDWVRAGQELGYPFVDLNGRHEEGFGILQYPIYKGLRQSTYSAFLFPMHKSPRLIIRRYALVRKILFRDHNNQAYGVEYVRHGKLEQAVATKEVILSAGTLGTSKLLMLSGVGPKGHLDELGIPVRSDLPVGRNLQDHLGVHLGPFFIREPKSFLFDRDVNPENIVRWLFLGTGPVTTTGYQAAASLASSVAKSQGEGNWPDLHLLLHGQAIHKGYADAFAYAYGLQEDDLSQYYANAFGRDSFHITIVGSRPTSTGQVLLSGASISDPLVVNPRYLEDPGERDFKILLEGVKTAMTIANSSIFQRFGTEFTTHKLPGCDDFYHGSDEYFSCYIRRYSLTMHNPVGTAAIGAVVDSSLRVFGTRGLRVVDASIQPTIVGVGTAASTFMIGEKGVDMILKSHGIPDRDTDLFDVVFGRHGFFKKNPALQFLRREFDTLNPLRALFKPFTSTKNQALDQRERFTRNSGINNPILQMVSSLFGNANTNPQADNKPSASSESGSVDVSVDSSKNPSEPKLTKRFGESSDAIGNVISKNQWILQTSATSYYTTPRSLPIHNPYKRVVPLINEYERLHIPNIPTVKGKGGRRYALLKAMLREAELNATLLGLPKPKPIVEVVKFERYNENEIDDTPDKPKAQNHDKPNIIAAKPVNQQAPPNYGILSVTTFPESSTDKFKPNTGKPSPFDDLIKHLKTFENFILSLTAKDRPRSWFSSSSAEGPFVVSHTNNPFHSNSAPKNDANNNSNDLSKLMASFLNSTMSATKGPINIGLGTSNNGSVTNPFQFLFGNFGKTTTTTTQAPATEPPTLNDTNSDLPLANVEADKNDTRVETAKTINSNNNIFSTWFNPMPKSSSTSPSWFKPFETNPSPQSSSTSWFKPFNFNDKSNPLFKPIDVSSWFKPPPPQQPSSPPEKSSPSPSSSSPTSWFKPFNFDSDTMSAVAITTPPSLPPTSDPLADLLDLFFGGLKKHERRAIYQSLESMTDAGQTLVDILGGNKNGGSSESKNFFQQVSTGKVKMNKNTSDSYKDLFQSLVSLNEFFNQYTTSTTTTTIKPHPLVEYLNTFDYPPSSLSTSAPPTDVSLSLNNSTTSTPEEIPNLNSTSLPSSSFDSDDFELGS